MTRTMLVREVPEGDDCVACTILQPGPSAEGATIGALLVGAGSERLHLCASHLAMWRGAAHAIGATEADVH